MVDNRIYGNGRLACLAVTDNQLALATANRNHGVDGLDAGLQGLLHRLAKYDTRGFALQRHVEQLAFDVPLAVYGMADSVHHAAHQPLAHLDGGDALGAFDRVSLINGGCLGQHHHTHIVFLQVLHDALLPGGELHQFACLGVAKAVDTRYAVTDGQHRAHLFQRHVQMDISQLFLQNCRHFGRFNF